MIDALPPEQVPPSISRDYNAWYLGENNRIKELQLKNGNLIVTQDGFNWRTSNKPPKKISSNINIRGERAANASEQIAKLPPFVEKVEVAVNTDRNLELNGANSNLIVRLQEIGESPGSYVIGWTEEYFYIDGRSVPKKHPINTSDLNPDGSPKISIVYLNDNGYVGDVVIPIPTDRPISFFIESGVTISGQPTLVYESPFFIPDGNTNYSLNGTIINKSSY